MQQKTLFRSIIGDSPTARVLEFLITARELDYSLTDIAQNSNIGWTTLHRIWKSLEKNEIVAPTRIIGKAKLYKLNTESKVVKELIRLYDAVVLKENKQLLKNKVIVKKTV